ncbi:MAG: hypothetical protein ACHP7F_11050, partial [Actinomycetales bacterium]
MARRNGESQTPDVRDAQAPAGGNADGGRRLSPLRVLGATLVAVVVIAGGVVGFQWWSAKASVDSKPWFASYVDVTATPRFAFENLATSKTKDAVL